jgi:hypothetical protein
VETRCQTHASAHFDPRKKKLAVLLKGGYTQQKDYQLCGYDKEYSVHVTCLCPVLALKDTESGAACFKA